MKKFSLIAVSLIVLAVMIGVSVNSVRANPSQWERKATATATTSVNYMSAGVGTTSLQYDALSAGYRAADSAALLIQFHGSSTNSVLSWKVEYSQNGVDWYHTDSLITTSVATSTYHVGNGAVNLWAFASSTPGTATAPISTSTKMVQVETPTRFVRAIFSVPVGSTPSAVWAEWIIKKQMP